MCSSKHVFGAGVTRQETARSLLQYEYLRFGLVAGQGMDDETGRGNDRSPSLAVAARPSEVSVDYYDGDLSFVWLVSFWEAVHRWRFK